MNPEEIRLKIYCALIQAHPNDYPDKILNETERFAKAYLKRFSREKESSSISLGDGS